MVLISLLVKHHFSTTSEKNRLCAHPPFFTACAPQLLGILIAFYAWVLHTFHVVVQAASNPQLLQAWQCRFWIACGIFLPRKHWNSMGIHGI